MRRSTHSSFGKVTLALALVASCGYAHAGGELPELQTETLDVLSPLAESEELVSRLLSPVTQLKVERFRESSGTSLVPQSLHAGKESYDVFVPSEMPPEGYGLLVFIWPGDDMPMPAGWRRLLEAHHLIFVAAKHSGNSENVLDRRIPLALHGYEFMRRHHRVDPTRVYVGGFSGGSRVAEKIALAYPDVFRGVLLTGGSDPLGTAGFVPPSGDLMALLQKRTRIVFATGTLDLPNRAKDARTRASFEEFCVQGVLVSSSAHGGHWPPEGRGMDKVLRALKRPVVASTDAAQCLGKLQDGIQSRLARVREARDAGRLDEARKMLAAIDDLYGGLAAPESQRLAESLDPALRLPVD